MRIILNPLHAQACFTLTSNGSAHVYVCICNAVTERDIHDAVAQGCRSMRQLREQLGVSADCGTCAEYAHQTLCCALYGSTDVSPGHPIPAQNSI